MLKIRLAKRGATHRPFYRVVVNDSARIPAARNIAEIGFYDPRRSPALLEIDVAKADAWISKGAVPSPRVKAFIRKLRRAPVVAAVPVTAPPTGKAAASVEIPSEAEAAPASE